MENNTDVGRDTHDIQAYRVRSYECGPDGKVRFSHLCNYLQETASNHAEKLGFSKKNFEHLNLTWVMTRMHVRLQSYPEWSDDITVLTFPHGMRKLKVYRDFILTHADGSPIGTATSEWMVIDVKTRHARRLPDFVETCSNTVREPVWTDKPFSRLTFERNNSEIIEKQFPVQHSHIDLNGHVNNVRYLEWMMECAPEVKSGRRVSEMEVVYRAEAMYGDTVTAQCAQHTNGSRTHQVLTADGRELITARTEWT